MTPRSTQLGYGSPIGTTHETLYTVPSNKRTIVKSVLIQNESSSAVTVSLWVYSGTTQLWGLNFHLAAAGSAGDNVTPQLGLVINAGQHIEMATQSGNVGAMLSGAELDL